MTTQIKMGEYIKEIFSFFFKGRVIAQGEKSIQKEKRNIAASIKCAEKMP